MPSVPIVDSHVHLWDPAVLPYPWHAAVPAIAGRHGPAELRRAADGLALEAAVIVEADVAEGRHLDEVEWLDALAGEEPAIAAIVAALPVERGAAATAADLERLAARPRVRGVRRLIQGLPDPSLVIEPDYLAGVRALAAYNLVFDLCVRHWQLGFAVELARRCPDVLFVLDHLGKPGIRQGLWEPWAGQLRAAGRLDNVVCKLSGAITEADHGGWTPAGLRPYLEHAVACFGFGRLMYGSDWPVAELTHGYGRWVAVLDALLAAASPDEQRRFWAGTAREVYRLGAPVSSAS